MVRVLQSETLKLVTPKWLLLGHEGEQQRLSGKKPKVSKSKLDKMVGSTPSRPTRCAHAYFDDFWFVCNRAYKAGLPVCSIFVDLVNDLSACALLHSIVFDSAFTCLRHYMTDWHRVGACSIYVHVLCAFSHRTKKLHLHKFLI